MSTVPSEIVLVQRHAPGDAVVMTAGVRDFKALFPATQVHVLSPYEDVWAHNPHVASVNGDVSRLRPHREVSYRRAMLCAPFTPGHYIASCHRFLEDQFGVRVPVRAFKGDIHLSDEELAKPAPFDGQPYWLFICGGKHDFTTKVWPPEYMQAVVDALPGVKFVQVGAESKPHDRLQHIHYPINGAENLVGKTKLRHLIRLVYHCSGVVCPVTMLMHLAAAVPTKPGAKRLRPCVVTAGGRESAHWEQYPGHQFLQTIGQLDCCGTHPCLKRRVVALNDGNAKWNVEICEQPTAMAEGRKFAKCQTLIEPAAVVRSIEAYGVGSVPLTAIAG